MRPDLGRRLAPERRGARWRRTPATHDVVFVVADGLSARAVQAHAAPVLADALPALRAEGWRIAPLVDRAPRPGRDRRRGRRRACAPTCVAVLIGERPGPVRARQHGRLPDLAAATPQTTDAERNCISNIRPEGIGYADAAFKLVHLLRAMRASGVSRASAQGRFRPAAGWAGPTWKVRNNACR